MNILKSFFTFLLFAACHQSVRVSVEQPENVPVKQQDLSRVNLMPDLPKPFKIIDYRQLALKFDSTIYDFNAKGE